jgi:hypothetical protein
MWGGHCAAVHAALQHALVGDAQGLKIGEHSLVYAVN